MAYLMIRRRKKNKFTITGNREDKDTDRIYSVQSSLKSHSLCVTLYSNGFSPGLTKKNEKEKKF